MANYNKATNFTAKDSLASGDPGKIVKGTEIDTEFNNIASAIASKADTNSPTFTGTPQVPTAAPDVNTTQIATTAFARTVAQNLVDAAAFPAGTKMLFQQTNAPTGWTKDTTHNNKALRIVNGSVSSGGSVAFTTAFAAARTVSGTVANHTLTIAQMPLHGHPWITGGGGDANFKDSALTGRNENTSIRGPWTGTPSTTVGRQIGGEGGGQAHNHGWSGSVNLDVQYVDLIIATKD